MYSVHVYGMRNVDNTKKETSWYTKVGDCDCQFGIGEVKFCTVIDQHVRLVRPTSLQSARSMMLREHYTVHVYYDSFTKKGNIAQIL